MEPRVLEGRVAALRPDLDRMDLPACVLDASVRYRYTNPAYRRFFGRKGDDMLGLTPDQAFGRPPSDDRRSQLERALKGETVVFDRKTLDGSNEGRWVRAHYMPIFQGERVIGVLVILVDIQNLKETQATLAEAERQISLITDSVGFPITYIDRAGLIRYANRPSADWVGVTPVEMLGQFAEDLTGPENMKFVRPFLERAFAGEKVSYEREAKWSDGSRRRIRANLIPDRDAAGEVRGVLSVVFDIEDDHTLKETLLQRTRLLELITDNVGLPISYIDRDLRYRYTNQPGHDWPKGATRDTVIGRALDEVYSPGTLAIVGPYLERALAGEKAVYERMGTDSEGRSRWIRVHVIPDTAEDGTVRGVFTLVLDIDEDRRLREELAAKEERLRLFTENIPETIALLDHDRRYVFVNRAFEILHGRPREAIVGRTNAEIIGKDVVDRLAPLVDQVLHDGTSTFYERLVTRADGERRWHHVSLVPHLGADGSIQGMYSVGHDVHELKGTQEALRIQEEALRFFAENIPEAIAYIDVERGCTFVNNQFLASRGFTREYVLGKFPHEVYPEALMQVLAPHLAAVMRGEESHYERLMRLPGGEEHWVRMRLSPHVDEGGRVRGYYVLSTDIHDIRVAQESVEEKERQLRGVIDAVPTPLVYVDSDLVYRYANDAFLEYVGKTTDQVIGRSMLEVLGEARWNFLAPLVGRLRLGETLSHQRQLRYADGRVRWMSVRLTPRMDGAGRFLGYFATSSDIHEQRQVTEELRRANSILSAHFDNTPLAVIELDPDGRVVRWSGQAEPVFGWGAAETLGKPLSSWRFIYEEDQAAVSGLLARLLAGPEIQATFLNRNYRRDGTVIWVEWHNSALRDETGRVISILSLAQDVSSRIQAEERLQYMATHDGLTALPNRVMLNQGLDSAIARAKRAGERVVVMFLDLDHFKDVNDTLGHKTGDELLKDLAQRLRGVLRQSDLLARISGDEFVMVLDGLVGDELPDRVAMKVLDEVRRPFDLDGNEVHVSASLGMALFPEDGGDADTLLRNADAAMYHAKELGRNNYRSYSADLAARRTQRVAVEVALRRALRNGELVLHYQPIIDLSGGSVRRVEALVRWNDPERGLVLPGAFIPVAEESGLGHDVGQWVMEAACKQARAWREAGLGDVTVCVNLSAGQLRDSAMISDLKRILAKTGCEPSWLQFEITETSMVRDLEGVSLTLAKLRRLGMRIAIDDFGTGFSSLSHLRHLPVDALKIDKSFVHDIDTGEPGRSRDAAGGAAIVSAVIGLARGLGLDVVAEGIEKEAQLAFLNAAGCSAGQGYLLCPPLPAAEFSRWLKARKK